MLASTFLPAVFCTLIKPISVKTDFSTSDCLNEFSTSMDEELHIIIPL